MDTVAPVKPAACEACGDYPVHHLANYVQTGVSSWLNDHTRGYSSSLFMRSLQAQTVRLEPHFLRMLHILSGGSVEKDPANAATDRGRAIWEEAQRRGIEMQQLIIFGQRFDSYRAHLHGRWVYFESLPIPPKHKSSLGSFDDKLLFKRFMQESGMPVANGAVVVNMRQARALAATLQMPVVVKPRMGSNSRHTTPFVSTDEQLAGAFALTAEICPQVLVEEYISGHLCRATVVDGKLVGFLESRQPQVMGDGVHTILELIDHKNQHKHERVSDIILSDENVAHMARQGYQPDSVLEEERAIQVARLAGRGSGGGNREMLADVHPKLRSYAERAATILKEPVVGFDLILPDARLDPEVQKWGFLEANTVPFIEIHTNPLYGGPSNVAAAVWDLWK